MKLKSRRFIHNCKKQLLFYILALLLIAPSLKAQTSFAILPITAVDVSKETAEEALNSVYQYIIESGKYRIIDRENLQKLLSEQSLSVTGAVDPSVASKIGKILGVDKLITLRIYTSGGANNYRMTVSVIDVTTSQIEFTKEKGQDGVTAGSEAKWCVGDIINEYPLIGKVVGKANNTVVINLGKKNALKAGDRLFVARKVPVIGDDGKVLMVNYNRIGVVEIAQINELNAQANIIKLSDQSVMIRKDDLVSPEPIPKQEAKISYKTPLLPNIAKGDLIFEDTMDKNYLSVENSSHPSYGGGKLQLNADVVPEGQLHVYCYYPQTVLDPLENFILECDIEFQKITDKYNKFYLNFRSNADYYFGNCYTFYVINTGSYEVFRRVSYGNNFDILPLQSTYLLNQGADKNKLKIVAYGSKFDLYVNDKFLVGFEDEYFPKGTIGFEVGKGGWATVDDLKIWSVKK